MTNNINLTASRIIDLDFDDEILPSTRDELRDLALDSIDYFLDDDDPDELTNAIRNCDRDALADAIADQLIARI